VRGTGIGGLRLRGKQLAGIALTAHRAALLPNLLVAYFADPRIGLAGRRAGVGPDAPLSR
jgi:hypothetical protein